MYIYYKKYYELLKKVYLNFNNVSLYFNYGYGVFKF